MLSHDGKKAIIILSILTVFTTILCVLRWIPRRRNNLLGTDDALLAFGLLMLYVQDAGAFLLAIKGGMGKPISTLSPDEVEWLFKMFFWPELGYTILISTIKYSILVSYNRIFSSIPWFRRAVYLLMALTTGWFVGVFFAVIFQCTPVDKAWKPMKPGTCIDLLAFLWGNSISNNILDYMILFLPVVPVCRLQVNKSQRVLLLGTFGLGSIACIAGTIRAVSTGTVDVMDLSKSVFEASVWTYIEPSMGIMGACLPFLAQLFRQRILDMLDAIWDFGSKTASLLRQASTVGSTPDVSKGSAGTGSGRGPSDEYEKFNADVFTVVNKAGGVTTKATSVPGIV